MSLEQRAEQLDEARRLRIIKSDSIDVEKYLHANDVTIKVKQARDFLDAIKESYLSTTRDAKILLHLRNPLSLCPFSFPNLTFLSIFSFRPFLLHEQSLYQIYFIILRTGHY